MELLDLTLFNSSYPRWSDHSILDRRPGNSFARDARAMSPDRDTLEGLRINRTAPPQKQHGTWILPVVVVLLLIAAGTIWWFTRSKAAVVRTITIVETSSGGGGKKTLLNASGYVTARRQATVSSKVTGKVVEVMVEEGMKVKEGQVLARLDASNISASLHLAEAQLESSRKALEETKASLEQAEREYRRVSELAANKIANQSDLDRGEADVKTLRARFEKQIADVTVSDRELDLWKQQLDDMTIRAPFTGIVTSKNAQPGEMISPISAGGGFTRTGICTLVDMNSLEVEVDVNESYINRVESGQHVVSTLDSYSDWQIPSKVIAIIPAADRQKATVKVRVGFDNLDPRILPDMGVKVAFQSGSEGQGQPLARNLSVPKNVVHQVDGRDVAWVVQDGKVQRRPVTIAGKRNNELLIAAGLSGGERVVIEGAQNLQDGGRVKEANP
jgi:HlyD family secretion protein